MVGSAGSRATKLSATAKAATMLASSAAVLLGEPNEQAEKGGVQTAGGSGGGSGSATPAMYSIASKAAGSLYLSLYP